MPHNKKKIQRSRVLASLRFLAQARVWRVTGIVGTTSCMIIFSRNPSWPTPDKILVFLTFVFMMFGQAVSMLKRFLPFVGLLLVYESFRGFADKLNTNVNYLWMPAADRWLFGSLPTAWLQNYWWNGQVQWYDFAFYIFYMLHFIFPLGLALLVWKKRAHYYWQYVTNYVVLSFAGFITYVAFPAAPPWLASDKKLIEPITRVSSDVWAALGIQDFPSLYNKISPNPVAAVPSLHAAYATLLVLVVHRLFGWKWALLSVIYPFMIYAGTVYQGEHYAIDAILGILYALVTYVVVDVLFFRFRGRKIPKKSPR